MHGIRFRKLENTKTTAILATDHKREQIISYKLPKRSTMRIIFKSNALPHHDQDQPKQLPPAGPQLVTSSSAHKILL
jgi:hypothetical protein